MSAVSLWGREEAGNWAGDEGDAEVWGLTGLAVESRLPFRAPERSALCVCVSVCVCFRSGNGIGTVCVCVCVFRQWGRENVYVCAHTRVCLHVFVQVIG